MNFRECRDLVANKSTEQKSKQCRYSCFEVFKYWKSKYGLETARKLIWRTVSIIAANDGKIKYSELALFNYCFGDSHPFSYDDFFDFVSKEQTQSNRDDWAREINKIDDSDVAAHFIIACLCVAYIDGEMDDREANMIYSINNIFENKF